MIHMREPVQTTHMREDRREQDRRDFKEDRRDPMMRRDSRAPPLMTEEERRGPMRQNRRVKFREESAPDESQGHGRRANTQIAYLSNWAKGKLDAAKRRYEVAKIETAHDPYARREMEGRFA